MKTTIANPVIKTALAGFLACNLTLVGCANGSQSQKTVVVTSEEVPAPASENTTPEPEQTTDSAPQAETVANQNSKDAEPAATSTADTEASEREARIARAREQGLIVLSGTIRIHYENWGGGANSGNVVSITLDEPLDYVATYKGSSYDDTAQEVGLGYEGDESYAMWQELEGTHVDVACEQLKEAIHDASQQGIDAIATGEVTLLG